MSLILQTDRKCNEMNWLQICITSLHKELKEIFILFTVEKMTVKHSIYFDKNSLIYIAQGSDYFLRKCTRNLPVQIAHAGD